MQQINKLTDLYGNNTKILSYFIISILKNTITRWVKFACKFYSIISNHFNLLQRKQQKPNNVEGRKKLLGFDEEIIHNSVT